MTFPKTISLTLALFLFMLLVFFGSGVHADEGMNPLYPGYPEKFDSISTISRIADNGIVFGDTMYYFSKGNFSSHTPSGEAILQQAFGPGDKVGLVSSGGTLLSIWMIEEGSPSQEQIKGKNNKSRIRLENGVWRNY